MPKVVKYLFRLGVVSGSFFFLLLLIKISMMTREKITYTLRNPKNESNKLLIRVLSFNPEQIYKRTNIDPYKRSDYIPMESLFPKPLNKKCSCGCGKSLKGRRTRWATDECSNFAGIIHSILTNKTPVIRRFLEKIMEFKCCKCGKEEGYREFANGLAVSDIEIDHIVAVCNGGGGCWLGNFQLLCHTCHKVKTQSDRSQRLIQKPLPVSNLFS